MAEISLKVGELVALFSGDARQYFATSNKVRADAKELDGMEPTVRPKIAETQASRAARAAGKTIGNSVKAGFASAGVGAALAGSMAVAAAAIPAAVGLAGALGVVAAAGKEVGETMSAYNAAQEAATQGAEAAAEAQAEFARQFGELTAEGQALTAQLISMGPAMDHLGDVAQSSVLPGFTQLLQTSEQLFPTVEHGLEAVGGAMSDTATQAAVLAGSEAFQDDLWSAFDNGADIVGALGSMMVNLTGDFVNFAGQAGPATAGMVDMVGSLSDGVSSFLSNAIPGMESYGSILRSVGGILDSTLSTAGELMAMLANEGAPTIERLEAAWSQLLGVVEQFASSGIGPLMASFGTLLDMLSGLLAVLEPVAPLLGTITGAVIPFIAALRLVDKVSFGGVKKKLRGIGEEIDMVEGKRRKFATGAKGMIGAVLNPWGLALAGVGSILMDLAADERAAAQAAAAHEQAVQSLTDAMLADGGVIGEQSRAVIKNSLANEKARQSANNLGIAYQLVTETAMGNEDATRSLNAALAKEADAIYDTVDAGTNSVRIVNESILANIRQGKVSADNLKTIRQAISANGDLTDKQKKRLNTILDLNITVGKQTRITRDAKQVAQELAAAENGVTVATLKHWRAALKLNNELMKSIDTNLSYRQATLQLESAQQRATQALNKHGKESIEYRRAALAEERAIQQVLKATEARTLATKESLPPAKRKIAADDAMRDKALELAATYQGPLPKALATFIGGMSRSEASARGVEIAMNDAGQAVYELPNGQTITITSNAGLVAGAMDDLKYTVQELDAMSATVDVFYRHYNRTRGVGMGRVVRGAYADGGLVGFPDGGLFRGRGGPRSDSNLIAASDGEFIVNARSTAQNLELLRAINSGQVAGGGAKSTGGASTMSASTFGGDGGSVMDAVIRLGEVTEREWRRLREAGWQGHAGDKMEALYPPLERTTDGFVRLGEVTEAQWRALREAGWTGIAGDKMEALYPPLTRLGSAIDGAADRFDSLMPIKTLSAKGKAAQELLEHIASGGRYFEDFSFRGSSANLGRFNDKLADRFYGNRPGFDFGPAGTTAEIRDYLRGVVNRQTTVNVESLTVESYSDQFDYRQVMDELAMQGVS